MRQERSLPGPRFTLALAVILAAVTVYFFGGSVPAAGADKEFGPSHMYAINLLSLRETIDASKLARPEAFDKYRVYTTRAMVGGKQWHRLRLGFFTTRKEAAGVMKTLKKDFPDAWVTKIAASERAASKKSALFAAPAPTPPVVAPPVEPPVAPPPPPKPSKEAEAKALMEQAGRAMDAEAYGSAIRLYTKVLKLPETGYKAEANELLGLAYQRKGNISQARAEYKTYLILYPDGEGAARVRERLAAIEAPSKPVKKPVKKAEKKPEVKPEKKPEKKPVKKPAKKPDKVAKKGTGLFMGVGATSVKIGGTFDGVSAVSGGGSIESFPELEAAIGMKFMAGYQFEKGSIEFNYSRSKHDGTWMGLDMPATFKSYNVDGKIFILDEYTKFVRPLAALGAGYNTLTVERGSTDGISTIDATFEGFDLRFGGGVQVALHEKFVVDLLAIYRWGVYYRVNGIASGDLSNQADGNGLTVGIEAKFLF